jgi:hypothetical protein
MPDDKEKKQGKMVDIDTSGPGAEVELPEEKVKSVEQEETNAETDSKDDNQPDDSSEKSDKQPDVQDSEQKTEEQAEPEESETVTEEPKEDQKKEMDEYGKGVKKRIAQLTKKMREAERQRDEAVSYTQRVMKEKDDLSSKVSKLDTGYASEMENRIKSSLAAAQAKLKSARENDDLKSEVEATTAMSQLGYEQAKLAELKTRHEMEAKRAKEQPKKEETLPPSVGAPDPKAQDFASKNKWFGTDSAMTYTAFDLHRKLTEEEGYDPQSDEYYSEVERRIKLEFPHKFGKKVESTSKPTQNVASATRSTKAGRKTVKLTPSQVQIAKKLGVPLEDYAKQLMNTQEV